VGPACKWLITSLTSSRSPSPYLLATKESNEDNDGIDNSMNRKREHTAAAPSRSGSRALVPLGGTCRAAAMRSKSGSGWPKDKERGRKGEGCGLPLTSQTHLSIGPPQCTSMAKPPQGVKNPVL